MEVYLLDQFVMQISYLNPVWGGCSRVASDLAVKLQMMFCGILVHGGVGVDCIVHDIGRL